MDTRIVTQLRISNLNGRLKLALPEQRLNIDFTEPVTIENFKTFLNRNFEYKEFDSFTFTANKTPVIFNIYKGSKEESRIFTASIVTKKHTYAFISKMTVSKLMQLIKVLDTQGEAMYLTTDSLKKIA